MTDDIRVDRPLITRTAAAAAKWLVRYKADGSFEVAEPNAIPFELIRTAIGPSISGGGMNHVYSTSTITGKLLPRDGILVGMGLALSSVLTAGTLTAKVQRASGGSVTGATLGLASGEQRKTVWWGAAAGFPYLSTETFGIAIDTDASFAPTANILNATLYFEMPS